MGRLGVGIYECYRAIAHCHHPCWYDISIQFESFQAEEAGRVFGLDTDGDIEFSQGSGIKLIRCTSYLEEST